MPLRCKEDVRGFADQLVALWQEGRTAEVLDEVQKVASTGATAAGLLVGYMVLVAQEQLPFGEDERMLRRLGDRCEFPVHADAYQPEET